MAIVGAGISGLALDRELHRRGVGTVVLEAAGRAGGVIRSLRAEGRVLDAGPQRTRLVPEVETLVRELGLSDRVVTAPGDLPLFVYRDGRLRRVPFSLREFVATDLLSVRGKLRILAEPVLPSAGGDPVPGETVASYVTRTLGREAHLHLVGPLWGGIYGSDPAEMPVEHSLGPALARMGAGGRSLVLAAARWMASGKGAPPAASFRDGMAELTDALRAEAGGRVELSRPATAVRRAGAGSPGGAAWRVETAEGEVRARRVVLTCPADEAGRLLAAAAPDAAERLGRLRYNRLAVVHLLSDGGLEGFGYQVALTEETATRGVTWNDALFDRDGVHTAYLGGALRDDVLERTDDELGTAARREFREATGRQARVLRVGRTRMPARDRSWKALNGLEMPEGIHLCANYVGRAGIPGRLRAAGRLAEGLAGGSAGATPPPAR